MGLFRKIFSLFKQDLFDSSVPQSGLKDVDAQTASTDSSISSCKHFGESYIDTISIEDESKKKKEWLEFLKTKRSKRKKELEEKLILIDRQLVSIQNHIVTIKKERELIVKNEIPIFNINQRSCAGKSTNIFEHHDFTPIISMVERLRQRIKEDRRKIEAAERIALNYIEKAKDAIKNKDIEQAKKCLDIISEQTTFIENKNISAAIKDVVFAITELSNQLIAEKREIEEQQRKEKALEAKHRAELLEKKLIEENELKILERGRKIERGRQYEEQLREKESTRRKEKLNQLINLSKTIKHDADSIIELLQIRGFSYFYHITEANNVPLIKSRGGLFSWLYLENNKMKVPVSGGDTISHNIDKDNGTVDYVNLYAVYDRSSIYKFFKKKHKNSHFVVLKIKIDVAALKNTIFSIRYADNSNIEYGTHIDFIEKHFDVFKIYPGLTEPLEVSILAKTFIPIEYIINIDNPEILTR